MDECAAFFDDSKIQETMKQHIDKGIELIQILDQKNYSQYIANLFGIDIKTAKIVLYVPYVFHDIGKGLLTFQERKKGFPAHEFYSAYIFYHAVNFNDKSITDHIREIMTLAIMLHHHTMKNRIDSIDEDDKPRKYCDSCKKIYQDYSKEYNIKYDADIKITNKNTRKFGKEIYTTLNSNTNIYSTTNPTKDRLMLRKVYALLYPIIMADNYSAVLNRKGNQKGIIAKDVLAYIEVLK